MDKPKVKYSTWVKTRTMPLSEIKILDKWKATTPDAEEQELCYNRYIQNGYFDRSIVIDDGKFLKDGYMAYRVARAVGLQTVKVSQIHLTIRYPEETPPEPTKLTFWQRVFGKGELICQKN